MVKINDATVKELHALLFYVEGYIKDAITSVCKTHQPDLVVANLAKLEKLRNAIILDNISNENEGIA